ncbi:MAG: tetratricopeptide repeat protein [Pseudomonadales bacterium]|nr:tetratricopeptide repeat protein [Pseudomonadales bacterium]
MSHANFNNKYNGRVLLETISTQLKSQSRLQLHEESPRRGKSRRILKLVSANSLVAWGRFSLLLGLLLCVFSTSSLALRNGYPDPYEDNPSFAPGTEAPEKETLYNPEFAPLYYNRGNAWYDKAEYLNAINDYNNALFLKPDMEPGYFNRGMAYFLLRQYKAAAEDFANTLKHNPNNTYAKIWEIVSLLKHGSKLSDLKTAEVGSNQGRVYKDWPSNLLAFMSGKLDEKTLIDAAFNPNPLVQVQQYCELWFYVGQLHLATGNVEQARTAFKKSIETGITDFTEYLAASNELE